eukprot:6117442-Amphidinium_carterae.1
MMKKPSTKLLHDSPGAGLGVVDAQPLPAGDCGKRLEGVSDLRCTGVNDRLGVDPIALTVTLPLLCAGGCCSPGH